MLTPSMGICDAVDRVGLLNAERLENGTMSMTWLYWHGNRYRWSVAFPKLLSLLTTISQPAVLFSVLIPSKGSLGSKCRPAVLFSVLIPSKGSLGTKCR